MDETTSKSAERPETGSHTALFAVKFSTHVFQIEPKRLHGRGWWRWRIAVIAIRVAFFAMEH